MVDKAFSYRQSDELVKDLELLKSTLVRFGAGSLAHDEVQQVIRHLKVFGFHLARLDIRQNSQYYEEALTDIIRSGIPEEYKQLSKKSGWLASLIVRELEQNRPFNARTEFLPSEQARETVEVYHSLRRHTRAYSERALGSLTLPLR